MHQQWSDRSRRDPLDDLSDRSVEPNLSSANASERFVYTVADLSSWAVVMLRIATIILDWLCTRTPVNWQSLRRSGRIWTLSLLHFLYWPTLLDDQRLFWWTHKPRCTNNLLVTSLAEIRSNDTIRRYGSAVRELSLDCPHRLTLHCVNGKLGLIESPIESHWGSQFVNRNWRISRFEFSLKFRTKLFRQNRIDN